MSFSTSAARRASRSLESSAAGAGSQEASATAGGGATGAPPWDGFTLRTRAVGEQRFEHGGAGGLAGIEPPAIILIRQRDRARHRRGGMAGARRPRIRDLPAGGVIGVVGWRCKIIRDRTAHAP